MVVEIIISSTSPPGGNQVDGLPPASSANFWTWRELCSAENKDILFLIIRIETSYIELLHGSN